MDNVDETVEVKYAGDEIIDLASSIWPEYEEKLRNPIVQPMTRTADVEDDSVIIQETYNLSENEVIMYVEKESGTAFALIYESWYETSQTSGSGYFNNVNANVYENGRRATETSSQPAYYTYTVNFVDSTFGWLYGSTIINFRIQNNQFYCSAE